MPIRPELRWLYPIDWPILSRRIRFDRARGRCESCGRPHGTRLWQLADGRWLDPLTGIWRDDDGRPSAWPDLVHWASGRERWILLGVAHLDHDPTNNRPRNLQALCQRCHLRHDRPEHLRRRRLRRLARRALGDLFGGPYPEPP
ncbi:hypothetical protein HRbin40_00990 [bacterium HR40]|nr:hypothetical protein HRbin40_00990 [bacterium HR40]